ncbi:MAG: trehalose-6-phosphate synthase [Rhodospirillaceae bacterium]|jgi:trehalose 6-phosphate synthase|nr:trehalose-6-phosphate synthase [Rhodospirillaceae bacterium]
MSRLVVVSNRVSLPSERAARAGGLAVAIREALDRHGGLWFGWSGETAESPDGHAATVTKGRIDYAVIDLTEAEFEGFYNGYANSTLWPLFHYRLGLVKFQRADFKTYLAVNARFAAALAPLLRPDDVVWIHDYQLLPLAGELRKLGVTNRIGFFLHIPLPGVDTLAVLPGLGTLMRGLIAADLIGFQTERDLQNFYDFVRQEASGTVHADGTVACFDRELEAGAFPIGIDAQGFAALAEKAVTQPDCVQLKEGLGTRKLMIAIDRLDYSKGIPNRFEACEELLRSHPEHRGRVDLVQIASPSRSEVASYRDLRREIDRLSGRVNSAFSELHWAPIRYLARTYPRKSLAGFCRIAQVGVVTPLRDGMNLVAKEYVAAQDPEDPGVLILSRFAGAAAQLSSALIVNPFDVDQCAEAMHRALTMPLAERKERWQAAMAVVGRSDVRTWWTSFTTRLRNADSRAGITPSRSLALRSD